MKKNFYSLILVFLVVSGMNFTTSVFAHSNGAPSGYTGSPGDGKICTYCHGGSATVVSGYFTTDIPSSGYVAGTTYNITVSFTGSGGKGFELSPQDSVSGTQRGTLIPGSGSKLVGGTKYITHSVKQTSTTANWAFQWTAPVAGTGNVTFFSAFVITQSTCHKESITVPEYQALAVVASATPSNLCSGSSTQLNAAVSGGSGTYSYTWTSVPPGFNSTIQNPTASPVVNTKYFVQVGDGSNVVNDSVNVTVQAAPTASAGNDTTVCVQLGYFNVSGTSSNSSSTLWTTSGDGIFTNPGSLHTVYTPGNVDRTSPGVSLTLTANAVAPCTVAASSVKHITFDPCTGIRENNSEDLSFSFWPNPTTGKITLSVQRTSAAPVIVSLSDLTGISRYRETIDSQELSVTRSLDPGNLSAGIYLVKIESGSSVKVQKLVIL
ncbi:MAG: T9SS type A sorting domain-containing protein [Bacteroidota bacterium]